MRFVEVAFVREGLTPCFAHVPLTQVGLTLACHSGVLDFPQLRVYS